MLVIANRLRIKGLIPTKDDWTYKDGATMNNDSERVCGKAIMRHLAKMDTHVTEEPMLHAKSGESSFNLRLGAHYQGSQISSSTFKVANLRSLSG